MYRKFWEIYRSDCSWNTILSHYIRSFRKEGDNPSRRNRLRSVAFLLPRWHHRIFSEISSNFLVKLQILKTSFVRKYINFVEFSPKFRPSSSEFSLNFRWIFTEFSQGLAYLHFGPQPIVHRDLKSGNVLVALDEQDNMKLIKITDFDTSRVITEENNPSTVAGELLQRVVVRENWGKIQVRRRLLHRKCTIRAEFRYNLTVSLIYNEFFLIFCIFLQLFCILLFASKCLCIKNWIFCCSFAAK